MYSGGDKLYLISFGKWLQIEPHPKIYNLCKYLLNFYLRLIT